MTHGKHQTYCACLLAAAFIAAASGAARAQLGSGGDYVLESSVVDNGGSGWLHGGNAGGYDSRGAIGQTSVSAVPATGGAYSNRGGFYDPPRLTYQKGLASKLSLYSGEVSISLPSDAVLDREMFEIGINKQSLNQPLLVEMAKVDEANRKMIASEGLWAQSTVNDLTEMYIFDEQSLTRDPLTKSGVLSMRYRDADGDGLIDGTNPPVRVGSLNAWVLNEKTNLWTLLPNMGFNVDNKTVTVGFRGPGVYNMIGVLSRDVERVKAYPVPFRPNGPQAGDKLGQTGTEAQGIIFSNVPDPRSGYAGSQAGKISIFTLDGKLVRDLDIATNTADPVAGNVKWDVKNTAGARVASGVYIWRVTSGIHSKTGKVMVIW